MSTGKFVIQNYTENYEEMVLNVMRKSFFLHEAVSVGSEIDKNVNAQKDLELLCLDALKTSGVTLIAIDKETGVLVGVSINVIQVGSLLIVCKIFLYFIHLYFRQKQSPVKVHILKLLETQFAKLIMQSL